MNVPADAEPQQRDADPAAGRDSAAPPGDPGPASVDRRTLDEVFGQVLPETTSDERDERTDRSAAGDDWYYENRPPHHDR